MNGAFPTERRERQLEKPLPSNPEAERVILGLILIDNEIMGQVNSELQPDHFYSPLNRRVYAAMQSLARKSKPIDPILIGEELKGEGSIESIGGISTITNLSFGIPRLVDVTEYITVLRQKAALRDLIRECGRISQLAIAEDEPAADILATAQTRINDLCLRAEFGKADERFVPLSKILDTDFARTLQNLLKGTSSKIKTGFPKIDDAIGGGISLSDVLLIAADTRMGKSALALQTAYQIAKQGIPTAFLAGEMSNGENVNRLLSQLSGITNLNWLTSITPSEGSALEEWADHIREFPIHFDHRTSDLQTLSPLLRSLVSRHGVKVLVVDYIQLLKVDRIEKRQRSERVSEASQEMRRIANDLGIAIIEVAQFNREGAKSMKPSLHDLEGSGQLEKDASIIFILEVKDETVCDAEGRYRPCNIRIVKGRNVGTGQVEGAFYAETVRFKF